MTVLGLLDERRNNLVTQRTRLVSQPHVLLRDLSPGGAPTDLTASAAGHLHARIRPVGQVEAARKHLARDVVDEIRDTDRRIKAITQRIAASVTERGSGLTTVDGFGPVVAGRLLGRTRSASRFATASAFASYAGVAPIEVASADRSRHRLARGGTASSTSPCTSLRSPRCGCVAPRAACTTTPRSRPARPTTKLCVV